MCLIWLNDRNLSIVPIITILGCSLNKKTPYKTVSNYFISYQKLDKKALKKINRLVNVETTLTYAKKEKYKGILKNNYKK